MGFGVGVSSLIIVSYTFILLSIPHIPSIGRRSKAFSTCSSHIVVVSIFFGSETFMYLHSFPVLSMDKSKVSIVFSTIVVLTLNSLIYSFRNKEVRLPWKKSITLFNRVVGKKLMQTSVCSIVLEAL